MAVTGVTAVTLLQRAKLHNFPHLLILQVFLGGEKTNGTHLWVEFKVFLQIQIFTTTKIALKTIAVMVSIQGLP